MVKTGRGGTPVPKNGKKFSAEHQPSSDKKKAGWSKKKALKDILALSTGKVFKGGEDAFRKLASQYLGIPEKEVNIRIMMEFRQIQKAIAGGDTSAFNAIFDRAYGKVKPEGEAPQTVRIIIKAKKK